MTITDKPAVSRWKEYYRTRVVSPEAAIEHIRPGDNIVTTLGHNVDELVAALNETQRERARAFIGIAHPEFRDEFAVEVGQRPSCLPICQPSPRACSRFLTVRFRLQTQ